MINRKAQQTCTTSYSNLMPSAVRTVRCCEITQVRDGAASREHLKRKAHEQKLKKAQLQLIRNGEKLMKAQQDSIWI
jgi:hypothetical protein